MGRRQREPGDCDSHQREGENHRGLATQPIAHPADHQAADGPRDETRAERAERRQQACRRGAGWEKGSSDIDREKSVGEEIVELECVSDNNRSDMTYRNRSTDLQLAFHDLSTRAGELSSVTSALHQLAAAQPS